MHPIAVDSSVLVSYFGELETPDTTFLANAIKENRVWLPPTVLSEMVSYPRFKEAHLDILLTLPLLEVTEAYWYRVGVTRRILLKKGLKAQTPDTLIAQSCIDHDMPLLTRDRDFLPFARHCGLRLALGLERG